MSGYRAVGDGVDRFVMGVINPVRVRATEMLGSGALSGDRAEAVKKLLAAPSIKWSDWNSLVDWLKMNSGERQ
jgi:hypothetical protein